MAARNLAKSKKVKLDFDQKDLGRADTLRFNVLTYVVEENYEKALSELSYFLEKDFEYPKFKERVERYIQHAVDLVNAIRAKRRFPGVHMLTMAKQQELNEKFVAHFAELQYVLKKVEKVQQDVRIDDVKSTVWIVRTAIHCVVAIAVVAFLLEVSSGLLFTALHVIDDLFFKLSGWIFDIPT